MTMLSAPQYFNLKTTEAGTVLVEKGFLKREGVSEKFGNRQFYFQEVETGKLKCLNGGSLAYVIDENDLNANHIVKITYAGTDVIENGKFAGSSAHQFNVELLEDKSAATIKAVQDETTEANSDELE